VLTGMVGTPRSAPGSLCPAYAPPPARRSFRLAAARRASLPLAAGHQGTLYNRAGHSGILPVRWSRPGSFPLRWLRQTSFPMHWGRAVAEQGTFRFFRGSRVTLSFSTRGADTVTPSSNLVFTLAAAPGSPPLIRKAASYVSPNQFSVAILPSETASLPPGDYVWDVWDQDAPIEVAYGTAQIDREVYPYP
jgi:hypothetical protein